MKAKVYNIQYDTDGESVDLPEELDISVDTDDVEIAEQLISDAISDRTGFCHYGFEYKIIQND